MIKKNIDLYLTYILIVFLMLKNTIILNDSFFTYGCLVLMALSFIYCIFNYKKILNKFFLITNAEVILFLVIQIIIVIGFKFSMASISVFINECFFLLVGYLIIVKDKNKYHKVLKFFVYLVFTINFIGVVAGILYYFKLIDYCPFYYSNLINLFGIYSNPNSAGIVTTIATAIYFSFFFNKKRIVDYLFLTFSIIFICFSGCRTAILVIPFYIVFYLIIRFFPNYKRKLVTLCSLFMVVFLGIFYSYIYLNKNTIYFDRYENKIDQILTHRYTLSKYSVLSLEDKFLVGINYSETASLRFDKIPDTIKREMDYSEIKLIYSNNNIHNSYSQIFANQGLIVLVLFLTVVIIGLYKTNRKNIPIVLIILIISFFESQLLLSKSLIMFIFVLMLGYREREKYKPNCNSILYINYVDMNSSYSGSVVRPQKIYQAFLNNKYDVKILTGTILRNKKRSRIKNIKEIEKWLKKNKPLFCYIESPEEPIIYRRDRSLIKLIHDYDIPSSYFYRDCYYLFPRKYVFESSSLNLKSIIKYFINLLQYTRDNILIKNNVDIVYFPSFSMSKYFNFKNNDILPPGCEICNDEKGGKNLIYVGALSENYGAELLFESLEIVNKVQKINLILICREKEYEKYHSKYGDREWLNVYHVSGREQLEKHYKNAKIALFPKKNNKYNDFAVSVKLFEYCGYGLPIIASNAYETNKIINSWKIGLVVDEDPAKFAKAIIELFNDDIMYSKIKRNVKRFSKENTWDDRVAKIKNDFKKGGYYEEN